MKNNTISVTLVHPFDPLGKKVGGVETYIRGFIHYAPENFSIRLIGIQTPASASYTRIDKWNKLELGDCEFHHKPIMHIVDENDKPLIPLSLRFTSKLWLSCNNLESNVLMFHRIEPALAFINKNCHRIGFIHNDIQAQLSLNSEYSWRMAPAVYGLIEKRLLKSFQHSYTVNMATYNLYQRRYPWIKDKLTFSPTWVDEEIFTPKWSQLDTPNVFLKQQFGVRGNGPHILFVGRLQKAKNPTLLIETFSRFLNYYPEAELIVVGEGNLRPQLKTYASQLGIDNKIFFHNFHTQEQLAHLYRACTVFLLTSRFEGMPFVCLESISCGTPVVTTNVGEVSQFVLANKTGEVANCSDPKKLAELIAKVVQHKEQYSQDNCLDAVSKYRPRRILEEIYERCEKISIENNQN